MKTSSLEILESSELPEAQARAILKVLEDEMSSSHENLATKADMEQLRLSTKSDLEQLRIATKSDMDQLRLATKSDLEQLRHATKSDLEQLRHATRTDLDKLRLETKADLTEAKLAMKADLNAFGGKLAWMVLTCFLTQLAVTVALAGVLYVRLGR